MDGNERAGPAEGSLGRHGTNVVVRGTGGKEGAARSRDGRRGGVREAATTSGRARGQERTSWVQVPRQRRDQ
jgi:hypothetical protein